MPPRRVGGQPLHPIYALERKIAARYGSEYIEAAGHAHMLMLEEGWERPFREVLAWLVRVI